MWIASSTARWNLKKKPVKTQKKPPGWVFKKPRVFLTLSLCLIAIFAQCFMSLNISSHSRSLKSFEMTLLSAACISLLLVFHYLVPFLRYSASYLEIWVRSHSRSLKNGTIGNLGYGFLVNFRSNYGRIFSHFDAIHERDSQKDRWTDTAWQHRPRLTGGRNVMCKLRRLWLNLWATGSC